MTKMVTLKNGFESVVQREEIIWHKYPEEKPASFDCRYLITHKNGVVERVFYEKMEGVSGMRYTFTEYIGTPITGVIAWAEMPRGWVEK